MQHLAFALTMLGILMVNHLAHAQRVVIDAVIGLHEGDTLHEKIVVWTYALDGSIIRGDSFTNKLRIYENGRIRKVKPEQIAFLQFGYGEKNERRFVSKKLIPQLADKKGTLYEEVVKGNYNWYRRYYTNAYDQSLVVINCLWQQGRGDVDEVGAFGNLPKRMGRMFFEDDDDLREKLVKQSSVEDLVKMLNEENQNIRQ